MCEFSVISLYGPPPTSVRQPVYDTHENSQLFSSVITRALYYCSPQKYYSTSKNFSLNVVVGYWQWLLKKRLWSLFIYSESAPLCNFYDTKT